jgi:large subunit ribosomal protein L3
MYKAIIGKKLGMTRLFVEDGKSEPVTVLEVGPCVVVQVKTLDKDKYQAVQLGFDTRRAEKSLNKPIKGHFSKNNVPLRRLLHEVDFDGDIQSLKPGAVVTLKDMPETPLVRVSGFTKGKGFQGVVRRHGFRGGSETHGSNFHRAPGSIGASSWPSRVFKGIGMPGRMGNDWITVKGLKVIKRDAERNLLAVRGAVPGKNGGYIVVNFV